MSNIVVLPPTVESKISQAARETARFMVLVPHDDGGCQFEIHAGGVDVEIEIDTQGVIRSVFFGRVDR